jgi:hypothetical protein
VASGKIKIIGGIPMKNYVDYEDLFWNDMRIAKIDACINGVEFNIDKFLETQKTMPEITINEHFGHMIVWDHQINIPATESERYYNWNYQVFRHLIHDMELLSQGKNWDSGFDNIPFDPEFPY